jgi:hypothetical protein
MKDITVKCIWNQEMIQDIKSMTGMDSNKILEDFLRELKLQELMRNRKQKLNKNYI